MIEFYCEVGFFDEISNLNKFLAYLILNFVLKLYF